jgi:hypothetical protein
MENEMIVSFSFFLFFRRRCAYRTSGKWEKSWEIGSPPLAGVSSSFPFRGKRDKFHFLQFGMFPPDFPSV